MHPQDTRINSNNGTKSDVAAAPLPWNMRVYICEGSEGDLPISCRLISLSGLGSN